jgi:hypothetical protein
VTYVPAIPATCELWIDGARYSDGLQGGTGQDDPVAMSDLRVTWGRSTSVDQPDASTCSFILLDPAGGLAFDQDISLGSVVQVWSQVAASRVLVFDGRVTDLDASSATPIVGGAYIAAVCSDAAADLDNRYVGDEPWPQETLKQRATRVLDLSGSVYSLQVDSRPAAVLVSRQDVDRRGAYGLLQDLATSAGAIVRSSVTTDGSPLVYIQDPDLRQALYTLAQDPADDYWDVYSSSETGYQLSADEVLQDPTHWLRDVTDLLTRATVGWLDPAGDPDPVERSVTVIDSAGEAAAGARAISVGSLLVSQAAATELASKTLATHTMGGVWRSTGLSWDLSASEDTTAASTSLAAVLLDIRRRQGVALALTDLPAWTPEGAQTSMYVEGGTYVYGRGVDGVQSWTLALNTVPGAGGGSSVTYGTIDWSILASDVDPGVSYIELLGVAMAVPIGPSWTDLDPAMTWATMPGTWYQWRDGELT